MTTRTAAEQTTCLLISASCTTSWFDWVHGELWLCPDGLIRRSLGLKRTLGRATGGRVQQTVDPDNRPRRGFSSAEIAGVVSADRRNCWIPWSDVSRATLKHGVIDSSLHIDLSDGRKAKFLWLRIDEGYDVLEQAMTRSLNGHFEARD